MNTLEFLTPFVEKLLPGALATNLACSETLKAWEEERKDLQTIGFYADDNWERAVQEFREYIETHPDSCNAYNYLGGALSALGNNEAAIEAFRAGVKVAERTGQSVLPCKLRLGMALNDHGKPEIAVEMLQNVLDNAADETPKFVGLSHLCLGNALNKAGRREEARVAWKKSIKLSRDKKYKDIARTMLAENPCS